jgi:trk system potassium uptake protein TrkH
MESVSKRIEDLPLIVILIGISAIGMVIPAVFAAATEDFPAMRAFLHGSGLTMTLAVLVGVATGNYQPKHQSLSHLFALFATFVFLPIMLALPVKLTEPDMRYLNAYVEMVSSVTTTGATFFDVPDRLAPAVHLWRATVAWAGGLYILVMAVAVLAPMNLGGFDVLASATGNEQRSSASDEFWAQDGGRRIVKYASQIAPLYIGLTLFLWLLLVIQTQAPMVSLVNAMSILSTSGISATNEGLHAGGGGIAVEVTVFFFLFLALSRQPMAIEKGMRPLHTVWTDPELRMGAALVGGVAAVLFARHWLGAFEVNAEDDVFGAFRSLWGSVFTALSFLSTTGFESIAWSEARDWSGLPTSGLILLGLALFGGGVATTAGGVKLLRVYALYVHGRRELDKLVHPSSVGGRGLGGRRFRREGAFLAWIFFMLFALAICIVVLGLTLTGQDMERAIVLAIAALSTTGPVANVALDVPISYELLSDTAKLILSAAMVLGRLETLVIIALFNPDFWRR